MFRTKELFVVPSLTCLMKPSAFSFDLIGPSVPTHQLSAH